MKRQFWTGGVLLIMILWGLTGCGGPKAPMPGGDASEPPDRMADGPGMVYTSEDQTPFAGTWRDADSTVVLEIEGQGAGERSRMKATVNGEPTFEAEVWVHASGNVKLTKDHKDILPPEPFRTLIFSPSANAFVVYLTSEEIFLLAKEMEDGTVEPVTADPFGLLGGPPPSEDYVRDGPGTFYTPEDQALFIGTWQSRDGTIVMEVTNSGAFEETSQMCLSVNGKPDFEAEMWVYSTGHVELSRDGKKLSISGTFCDLRFSTVENAFYGYLTGNLGTIWLTKDGAECGEKDVVHPQRPQRPQQPQQPQKPQPPQQPQQPQQPEQLSKAWVCPSCKTENTGKFCTECGSLPPAACEKCGWKHLCVLSGVRQPPQVRSVNTPDYNYSKEQCAQGTIGNRRNENEHNQKMDGGTVGAGHGTDTGGLRRWEKWWKERRQQQARLQSGQVHRRGGSLLRQ